MAEDPGPMKTNMTLAALIVMLGMTASRLLGYAKTMIIAFIYGRGMETDAFYTALSVPDVLYMLLAGGALSAAVIPVISDILVQNRPAAVNTVLNSLGHLMVLLMAVGVALELAFTPLVVRALFPGFTGEQFELTVALTRLICPVVFFTGLSALSTGILHAHNRFITPAAGWSLYNLGIIFGAVALRSHGVFGLGYGALIGAAALLAVQVPDLVGIGYRYRPAITMRDPDVRRTIGLFVPAMLGLSVMQINLLLLPMALGSTLGEGANTALRMANQLLVLPIGVFAVAISSAVFPTLSRQAGAGNMDEFKLTLNKGLRGTFLFSLPSTAVLIALAAPLVRLLFEHGEFTAADSRATALALACYAVGLAGHSALHILVRSFYAMKDTVTPVFVGLGAIAGITIPLGLGLARSGFGLGGIALAVSVNALVSLAALLILLRRRIGAFDFTYTLKGLAKTGTGAGVMAAVVWACAYKLPWSALGSGVGARALQVLVPTGVGAGVYLAVVLALKTPEAEDLLKRLRLKLRPKGRN